MSTPPLPEFDGHRTVGFIQVRPIVCASAHVCTRNAARQQHFRHARKNASVREPGTTTARRAADAHARAQASGRSGACCVRTPRGTDRRAHRRSRCCANAIFSSAANAGSIDRGGARGVDLLQPEHGRARHLGDLRRQFHRAVEQPVDGRRPRSPARSVRRGPRRPPRRSSTAAGPSPRPTSWGSRRSSRRRAGDLPTRAWVSANTPGGDEEVAAQRHLQPAGERRAD